MQKPTKIVLADLEHELRLSRHPVRLGAADGQHERHLRVPGRARRSDSDSVAGGPADGLLVQPIIGHASDHTWTRLGRRRPYFLAGAILSSCALILMPRSLRAVDGGRACSGSWIPRSTSAWSRSAPSSPTCCPRNSERAASRCRACSSDSARSSHRRYRGCSPICFTSHADSSSMRFR